MSHTFHIPVLGLGYSIDTPLKVAAYGISSVVSIVDDELTERMRKYHIELRGQEYVPIPQHEADSRAKRITAYLNLLNELIKEEFELLRNLPFEDGRVQLYFSLLPGSCALSQGYELMREYPEDVHKKIFQDILRRKMTCGAIDVNIMAKVDKANPAPDGGEPEEYFTDALAALRGFANSSLESSVVLSAGMNPRLYSYLELFPDFFPDANGRLKKKITLKVSDFRSAQIQAKFLAKKGVWVSEFRVESGLNCGGHAFATDGFLAGPILEEFKQKRAELHEELYELYQVALIAKGFKGTVTVQDQRITYQGGIGTAEEQDFLISYYELDGTGWGSPFLLVPEVTNVDDATLTQLANAAESDFFLSRSSPLGVLFNNFMPSGIEEQRVSRIEKGRPGSPCTRKFLVSNTEFTEHQICTASREYQVLKLKELAALSLDPAAHAQEMDNIQSKVCLCEGLTASVYIKYGLLKKKENRAVAICPGPNLAYFSGPYSFVDMVSHIYGRVNLFDSSKRPMLFIKELKLYIEYLQRIADEYSLNANDKRKKYLQRFKEQLHSGVNYYRQLFNERGSGLLENTSAFITDLLICEAELDRICLQE